MHNKTVFDNGLRVVTEKVAEAHTVSLGIWVDVGSRDEDPASSGISHFVEHMFFKGTERRSARQIAKELDSFGGMANAFTSKDTTCLYATVLASKLPALVDLFGDMLQHSLFTDEEVGRERQVILQEISMVEDTPEEQAHECFEERFWGDHSLARPVLGDPQVVGTMKGAKLHAYIKERYGPDKIVISCAGQVDHDELCRLLAPLFGRWPAATNPSGRAAPQPQRSLAGTVLTKELEQVQVLMAVKGLAITAPQRYALVLLNTILGANMSSRLFQEVRETRGLAYSISSFIEAYTDCGYLGVSCGVAPAAVNETLAVIAGQLQLLTGPGNIGADELSHALDHASGSLYLAAENLDARMTRNARNELYFGRQIPLAEVVDHFGRVGAADIAELAGRLFRGPHAMLVMGPVAEEAVVWP